MKRLLLLALPALLAGCPKPQPATDAAPPAATTTPSLPGASLWLLSIGGLWLCLRQYRRWQQHTTKT